jgi:redox-sensitive bicupin YhaK (pirin superfamily)
VTQSRAAARIFSARPTLEGAGVRLKRAFGFAEVPAFDPFLLLDDFGSDDPADYLRGFPWHPHRGIETITYMLNGRVDHGDSLGNSGVIGPGDVQWMTAGSGIIHQEMPRTDVETAAPPTVRGGSPGRRSTDEATPTSRVRGFQLWSNLPTAHKMMAPRYQEVRNADIPTVDLPGGAMARVVCGEVGGVRGPVQDIMTDPEYLDVTIPEQSRFSHPTPSGARVFAYVFAGTGSFGAGNAQVGNGQTVLFADGDQVEVATGRDPVRFLLVRGQPLGEPIAWRGPIVMNTEEELLLAFREYEDGTFVKLGSVA